MSVTVRTDTDPIAPVTWTAGTHWEVQDGNLWVIAADRTIAEYPAGRWLAVWRDPDDKPQDGVSGSALTTVTINLRGPIRAVLRHIDAIRADECVTVLR